MITNEQRAHDLALICISRSLQEKEVDEDSLLQDKSYTFELAKSYYSIYKNILKSINEEIKS